MSDGDLGLLLEAAHEAGALASRLRRAGLQVTYKDGDNTPLTNADEAVDALVKQRLQAARPDYGWLSEETADDPDRLAKRRIFVVDPIDGTRAFLNDRPWWSVALAVVEGDRPITGVVFAPELEETYAAELGQGATLNGQPSHVSAVASLEDCRRAGDPRLFAHPRWPTPWPEMRVSQRNSTAYRM